MARTCKFALAALLWALGGCEQATEPITLQVGDVQPALDYNDLAFVLQKALTKDGLLIGKALQEHADRLDRQLKRLAVTGPEASPELFGSDDDKIAYWYNARAAWSMRLALACKCPERISRAKLLARSFPLDGRQMSLDRIDHALKAFDDWRILVASPGVTFGRCPLPAAPFSGKDVRREIEKRLSDFLDREDRLVVDVERRSLIVPPVLWQFRERIIREHQAAYGCRGANLITALLPHATGSAHRRLQDAVGYRPVPASSLLLVAILKEKF